MEQLEEMIYMAAGVGFFIVAISFFFFFERGEGGLYEAYRVVEVPQGAIAEVCYD